jgi:tripartite-type tricarboxylate transporter receptor subunit TctC
MSDQDQVRTSAAMVGTGGLDQIAGTYFQQKTGTRFQFVPYRGAAPAIQDLMAGGLSGVNWRAVFTWSRFDPPVPRRNPGRTRTSS